MKNKISIFLFLLIALSAFLNPFQTHANAKELKVGFVYITTIQDAGWTYAHELGRRFIDKIPRGHYKLCGIN